MRHRLLLPLVLGLFGAPACTSHGEPVTETEGPGVSVNAEGRPAERVIELVSRTPYLPTYPCGAQCHDDRATDPTPRAMTLFHVGRVVEHGPALDFCNDCHALDDVDQLVLLDHTTRVGFDSSDQLCAQCHGTIHDDWEEGIHGLSTGGWQGTVQRRLCTACHDPHGPGPLHFQALPVPVDARRAAGHGGHGEAVGHAEGAGPADESLPEEVPERMPGDAGSAGGEDGAAAAPAAAAPAAAAPAAAGHEETP